MTSGVGAFLVMLLLLVPVVPVAWFAFRAYERFYRLHARRHGQWPYTRWWMFWAWHPRYMWSIAWAPWQRDPDPDVEAARRRYLRLYLLTLVTFLIFPCLGIVLYFRLAGG